MNMKKKAKVLVSMSMVLVFVMTLTSTTVFAAQSSEAQQNRNGGIISIEALGILEELADEVGLNRITLTPEARYIALEDFDYLADKILQVAPTQNIAARRLGISLEEFFGSVRRLIYNNVPMPSFMSLLDERWIVATDDLYIAADYMMTILTILEIELGALGHMAAQPNFLVEMFFFLAAYNMQEEINFDELRELFEEAGITDPDEIRATERFFVANRRFQELHYEIYNTPSVLWFYGLDPSEFDFDADIEEIIGTMDEDNITTAIIEYGRIAYFHINSFLNNMMLDSEVLFPFYEQIQDYEHLIIDIRGNGGGITSYFPMNVMIMLVDTEMTYRFYEFFIDSELTSDFFENPHALALGNLYGIFPAAEFVQNANMPYFNQDDLDLLDYVIVWYGEYAPIEGFSIPFGGQIWLLVDGGSMSASEMAAILSMNTGFATVVGEPTAGVTQVIYTFAALPNTGILFRIDLGYSVDRYGRSVEEFGVIPQIANMPEMDAVQTVLALIDSITAELDIFITLDGEYTDAMGVIINDRTLISVSDVTDIFSAAQLIVHNWQATLIYGEIEMILTLNSQYADVDGEYLTMHLPVQVVNGEMFVPLRFITETFGYDIDFYDGVVIITSN